MSMFRSRKYRVCLEIRTPKSLDQQGYYEECIIRTIKQHQEKKSYPNDWKTEYWLPFKTVSIKQVKRKTVSLVVQYRTTQQNYGVIFCSQEDAKEFVRLFKVQKQAEEKLHTELSRM